MENSNSKIATISFIAAGILAGIVAYVILNTAAAVATGGFGRFISQESLRHIVPVVVGAITFFVLQFNKKVLVWAEEVIIELRRIVWPSRRDTTSMTIMVCVMLVISGLVLGFMDVISASVIDYLLHQNFFGIFA